MNQSTSSQVNASGSIKAIHGFRYQVKDVARGQTPGGWNRVVLKVADLPACIAALEQAGVTVRNAMEVGPGGRLIQIEDPDGNPLELFEPASRS